MQQYETLAKKHGLPSFEEIDREFDMTEMPQAQLVLRNVRKKIIEKINFLKEFMEDILQPEANLPSLIECKSFTDKQKDDMYNTYKKVMQLMRKGVAAVALETDAKDAEFIKYAYKEWQPLKKEIAGYAEVAQECWHKEEKEEKESYLG